MEVSTVKAVEDQRKARDDEYGTFVATEQIFVDGSLGYNVGDAVPVSVVKRLHLDKAVQAVKDADKK